MKKLLQLGPYKYNEADDAALSTNREKRPPTKVNGDIFDYVYDGEWIKGTKIREGKGTLVQTNGDCIYHGWF